MTECEGCKERDIIIEQLRAELRAILKVNLNFSEAVKDYARLREKGVIVE